MSTFLPLPASVDDLNFSNLLDRQLRDQARVRMRSVWKLCAAAMQDEVQQQWQEAKATLPEWIIPYLTTRHAAQLGGVCGSLLLAQLSFSSPRFRSLLLRFSRLSRDVALLAAAMLAATTAYRELHHSMPDGVLPHVPSQRRLNGGYASAEDDAGAVSVLPAGSSTLPSLLAFRRAHALSPAIATLSPLRSHLHSLSVLCSWLRLRYRHSGPLRLSTLVLAMWLAWLGRRTKAAEGFKAFMKEKIKQAMAQIKQQQ